MTAEATSAIPRSCNGARNCGIVGIVGAPGYISTIAMMSATNIIPAPARPAIIVPGISGYQADLGDPKWWGCLYDEARRNKVLVQSNMDELNKVLKRGDWNDYEIRCEGKRIRAWLNGVQTFDYTEVDDSIPQFGIIGLQVHGGGKALASYKSISVEELP